MKFVRGRSGLSDQAFARTRTKRPVLLSPVAVPTIGAEGCLGFGAKGLGFRV